MTTPSGPCLVLEAKQDQPWLVFGCGTTEDSNAEESYTTKKYVWM